ncbi:MAG: hypothetical protein PVJ57_21875 [Phycisphaerae bacterium]|jgi:hypothetical protein
MSLLREIQDAAADSSVRLSDLLRKAKILAARLGHDAFKQWVERELNGYPAGVDVPEYRVTYTQNYGHFAGPWSSGLRNAPIPSQCLPEHLREHVEKYRFVEGVSSYEQILSSPSPEAPLHVPWDPNLIALVAQRSRGATVCISAWQRIADGALAALLDTVRNKLLDFVLEIEAAAPGAGEAPPGVPRVPGEKVGQIFNTYILGGNALIAESVASVQMFEVAPNDMRGLRKILASLGVESDDAAALEAAVQADPKPTERKLGPGVAAWVGKMVAKAGSGAWSLSMDVAGSVLSKLICSYYGLK